MVKWEAPALVLPNTNLVMMNELKQFDIFRIQLSNCSTVCEYTAKKSNAGKRRMKHALRKKKKKAFQWLLEEMLFFLTSLRKLSEPAQYRCLGALRIKESEDTSLLGPAWLGTI